MAKSSLTKLHTQITDHKGNRAVSGAFVEFPVLNVYLSNSNSKGRRELLSACDPHLHWT